jgi:tripeptidyl-peptidase-1
MLRKIPNGTHPVLNLIDGATAPVPVEDAGGESSLDFQISYPILWPQNSALFQTDDDVYENNYTFEGFLNNFFDAIDGSYCKFSAFGETGNSPLDPPYPDPAPGGFKGHLECGVFKRPNVISISYGGAEADLPISYQRRQCAEIAKLGLQGTTVFVSSGDSGVAGRGGDPTPSNCLGVNSDVFAPQFPATCPFVTAVGSTG